MNHIIARISPRIQYIPFIIVVLSLLYRFFDRSAMFHDEIINLDKAERLWIFDYALRPVFYGMDSAAVKFFGVGILSTSFAAYIAFVFLAWFTYKYLCRDLGQFAAISGLVSLAWLGDIYSVGIRGLPHIYPAVFVMAALYVYHRHDPEGTTWKNRWKVTALLLCGLLSHPTGIALVIGFFSMVVYEAIFPLRRASARQFGMQLLAWGVPFVSIFIVIEGLFHLFEPLHHSYLGYWVDGVRRTSSNEFSKYFQPYDFYFVSLGTKLFPILVLTLLSAIVAGTIRFRGGDEVRVVSPLWKRAFGLGVIALVSIAVVSMEKWKFSRVEISFFPVAALALVYGMFALLKASRDIGALLRGPVTIIIVVISSCIFIRHLDITSASFEKGYPAYSASFDIIRHLDTREIGYIGPHSHVRIPSGVVSATGKSMVELELSTGSTLDPKAMLREIVASDHEYLLVDTGGNRRTVDTFHKLAFSSGFTRLINIRSKSPTELWVASPSFLGWGTEAALDRLRKNGRVGLLIAKRDKWLRWSLDRKNDRVAHLDADSESPILRKYQLIFLSPEVVDSAVIVMRLKSLGYRKVADTKAIAGGRAIEVWEKRAKGSVDGVLE